MWAPAVLPLPGLLLILHHWNPIWPTGTSQTKKGYQSVAPDCLFHLASECKALQVNFSNRLEAETRQAGTWTVTNSLILHPKGQCCMSHPHIPADGMQIRSIQKCLVEYASLPNRTYVRVNYHATEDMHIKLCLLTNTKLTYHVTKNLWHILDRKNNSWC